MQFVTNEIIYTAIQIINPALCPYLHVRIKSYQGPPIKSTSKAWTRYNFLYKYWTVNYNQRNG